MCYLTVREVKNNCNELVFHKTISLRYANTTKRNNEKVQERIYHETDKMYDTYK